MSEEVVKQDFSFPAVAFIGAGPGDAELITVKGQRLLQTADFVLYSGSLISPQILAWIPETARKVNAVDLKLEGQIDALVEAHREGKRAVRLMSGDPSIYGTLLEQVLALKKRDIPYTIVPGVSSAFAAAAALGIEYTAPGLTQTVIFTRLQGNTQVPEGESLRSLAEHRTTLVVFLSAGMAQGVADELTAAGYDPETPVAVIYRASWDDEQILFGTLADIAEKVQRQEITHQALIVVSPTLDTVLEGKYPERSFLYGKALDVPRREKDIAVVALTHGGTQTALELKSVLQEADLYAPERFLDEVHDIPGVFGYSTSVRQVLQDTFRRYQALVCVMATGIVVRDLAPLVQNKSSDPAVVVLDENGDFAISLLSGHLGGANDLARRVATLLGGQAVISTASDVQRLPALDLLGQAEGWRLEEGSNLTTVSAALVNGEPLAYYQDAGDESWLPDPLPENMQRFTSFTDMKTSGMDTALIVTHRAVAECIYRTHPKSVIYHPACLALGIGCNRSTPAAEIREAVETTLKDYGLSPQSVFCVGTVEDKAFEAGLHEVAAENNWRVKIFSRDEIRGLRHLPNPSPYARRVLGVEGVAEPAAMLAGGVPRLLVEKRKFKNVTVAVSRRDAGKP